MKATLSVIVLCLMALELNAMNVPNCIPYENPSCRPGGSEDIFTPLGACFEHLDCDTGCACNYKVTIYDPCTCVIKGEWFAINECSASYLCGFSAPTGFVPDSSPGAILALFQLKPSPSPIYQRVYEAWVIDARWWWKHPKGPVVNGLPKQLSRGHVPPGILERRLKLPPMYPGGTKGGPPRGRIAWEPGDPIILGT